MPVTGGAGFTGTNLVNELRRRGCTIHAADLINTDRDDYTRADVRSHQQLERLLASHEFDIMYHLAAEYSRWNGEDYHENLCGRPTVLVPKTS